MSDSKPSGASLAKNLNILLTNTQNRLNKLQGEFDELQQHHNVLLQQHHQLQVTSNKFNERSKSAESEYRYQIQQLSISNTQLNDELTSKIQQTTEQLSSEYEIRLSALQSTHTALHNKHEQLNERHSKLIDTHNNYQRDTNKQNDEYQHEIHELNQRIDQLNKQLSYTATSHNNTEIKLSQTKNETESQAHQIKQLAKQLDELQDNHTILTDQLQYSKDRYTRLEYRYDSVARDLSDQRHSIYQFKRIIKYCAIVSFVRSYQAKKLCYSTYNKLQLSNNPKTATKGSAQYAISQSNCVKRKMLDLVDLVDTSIQSLFDSLQEQKVQNAVEKHNRYVE